MTQKEHSKKNSQPKICDHSMVHFLTNTPTRFRACIKCKKYWPRPHPTLTESDCVAVVEFGIFVAEQAEEKKKAKEKARKLREREKQEELDLL